MIAEYIKAEPFAFKEILDFRMEKGMNTHGGGVILGYIRQEDVERYSSYPVASTPIILWAVGENGEERIVFYGILADSNITRENSQYVLEIQFTAYTRLMDLTKQTRAFQNASCTYQDMLAYLCANYEGSNFIMKTELSSSPIQELIVQYQETNWEFILRLASHFQTMVISDFLTPGVKFYFGLPQRTAAEEVGDCEYRLEKSLLSYQYKTQNDVTGTSEYDDMSVIIKSRNLWEVGDRVLFEGRPYVINQAVSSLDGHQLTNAYVLMTENGLKTPKSYNEKIIGASIDAIVSGVKGSVVSVILGIEDIQPSSRWYSYATVFSSPDGSGWYCMPQAGDEVRLYFPTRSEKHSYAVSSVHKPVSGSPPSAARSSGGSAAQQQEAPRSNPTVNELRSPDGKVVQFNDNSISLTNGEGLSINMIDGQGIFISSTGNISLDSGSDLDINGSNIEITASSSVTIAGSDSSIRLNGEEVTLAGKNVKIQE